MDSIQSLALIDGNLRRRAAICRKLRAFGKHAEPFEEISDMKAVWPHSSLILALDDGDTIKALIDHMGETGTWLPILAYAEDPEPRQITRAVLEGAVGYIAWPFDETELTEAIGAALQDASSLRETRLRQADARTRIGALTRREREVLAAVANGLPNRMIGQQLGISPRTVEIHRSNMLHKIGAHHTSEAIRIAIEASLLS